MTELPSTVRSISSLVGRMALLKEGYRELSTFDPGALDAISPLEHVIADMTHANASRASEVFNTGKIMYTPDEASQLFGVRLEESPAGHLVPAADCRIRAEHPWAGIKSPLRINLDELSVILDNKESAMDLRYYQELHGWNGKDDGGYSHSITPRPGTEVEEMRKMVLEYSGMLKQRIVLYHAYQNLMQHGYDARLGLGTFALKTDWLIKRNASRATEVSILAKSTRSAAESTECFGMDLEPIEPNYLYPAGKLLDWRNADRNHSS